MANTTAGVTIIVRSNKLAAIAAALPDAVEMVLEKFMLDVDADATAHTPVDSGNLKNSRQPSKFRIYWPAHYAAYVNFGTRFMAARPFASDAVDRALPGLEAALDDLEGMLRV